ncbi:MAG TPA: xanthine dehydrogenase family protein molybdopterin-binding subunit [Gemmatimonadaceae bacterium]|nr:xanthine dehydrogenase family protein molybdopterin-binding subunit [Gemmatimonadaceae bacterium]
MAIDTGIPRRFVTTTVEVEGREETKVVELPEHDPSPWGTDAQLHVVGQRAVRIDAPEKVTGRAKYTVDVARVGMLHAAVLRSTIARGNVTLDVSPARAVAGVVDVISVADIERRIRLSGGMLFDTTVSYAGQPLAAVCAETLDAARRGVEAIEIRYDVEPHVGTFVEAVADGTPAVRRSSRAPEGTKSPNLARSSPDVVERGDVERGRAEAEVIVRRSYRTPVALHTALEPHAAVAEWDGDRVTVWESTQAVFAVRAQLATGLGISQSSVRVIKEHMGGGFGAKTSAGAHTFVAALLARRTGRPVRCVNDREAEQSDAGNRPSTEQRVTLGARRNGRLTLIECEADVPLGIGGWEGGPVGIFQEMYSCPNVRTVERFAYVNTSPMTAFRAPGHVEGAFALESAMDALARELSIDPLELRRINFAARDEKKDREYSSNRLLECYERGATAFDWDAPRVSDGVRRRGKGVAAQVWGAGGGPPAYAIVKINGDGSADVLTGTQDLGTGSRTILAQIAAEALGAKLADVRIVLGDTERTPYTGPSWGSMTTASVGPAVRAAAEDALRQLMEAAAEILEVPGARLTARDGMIATENGSASITFRSLCNKLGDVMIIGRGSRGPNPTGVGLSSFGAQFADVEVDAETGVVRVLRIVAVHDAGRIINPTLAESQVEGGIIQGLGFALFEERHLDPASGVPLNANVHDYKIPTIGDVPKIHVELLDVADPAANHTGARGLAEPPIIPTAPAIANAIADALGVEVLELPMTPWRVLDALRR